MRKTAEYLFLTALLFTPMAFGTVETWSCLIMEVIICASALFLYFSTKQKIFYQVPGILPLILVLAFILLQIIPLPGNLVKFLSPATFNIYHNSSGLIGPADWIPISICPRATIMELLRLSAYVLFYITAVQLLANRIFLKRTVEVVAWFAALLSIIVIIEFITKRLNYPLPHDKILWIRQLSHGGTPAGPYVNRNHYAGLMEMIFPLILSMFLAFRPILTKISLKRRIADFFNQKRIHHHFLYGTAAILIATSLLLSLSRGGIISLALSMNFFATFVIVKARQKKTGLFIAIIIIIVLFLTGTSGWNAIFDRFENIRNQSGIIYDNRYIIWTDCKEIIRDFPLLGTGAGTVENIYPIYRSFPGNDILEHAHNDYLEFLCTGGITLPTFMFFCLFSILFSATKSFNKRREWYSILLFAGCITSISAILLHSLVDFNMQIGANGLYFFFILALTVSAANTRLRSDLSTTYLEKSKKRPYVFGISAMVLCVSVIYINGGALIANYFFSDYQNIHLTPDMSEDELYRISRAAQRAAAYDSLNPKYHQAAAQTAAMMGKDTIAFNNYTKSIRRGPTNSRHLHDAGYFVYQQGNTELAERIFRNSIQCDKKNMAAYIKYAAMLFEEKQMKKGLEVLKSAMSINTDATGKCLSLMVLFKINEDQMVLALPDRVEPHLELGNFFDSLGNKQKTETSYLKALEYLPNETQIKKSYFIHVYTFYRALQSYKKALFIIQQAIEYFPDDDHLHRIAGDLYKKIGIDYRADEEYRKARILE
ncbi:MAG: O-antigen ligase family protein [Desulfobacteraceae bacterium]|nr:O-antigen ligase family protein [Desulfobacteraceae bacterium]